VPDAWFAFAIRQPRIEQHYLVAGHFHGECNVGINGSADDCVQFAGTSPHDLAARPVGVTMKHGCRFAGAAIPGGDMLERRT